ncbi:MAG: sugar phosphate isomerase/epimerase [Thaumarchaeota archaeon]|nr:sugar phosphate isomerase/epimerase [Nitrososphaerota archaeon]
MARQSPSIRAGGISFRDYTLEEACQRMKAVGYDGFEVFKPQIAKCKTPELLEQFVDYTKRMGLQVCALNDVDAEDFRPFDPDNGFERTVQFIKEGVRLAGALGVKDVMFWEGVRPRGSNQSRDDLLKVMIRLYKEAVAYSSKSGITLLVEPHPFSLGMDLDYLVRLCDALDPRYFGVLYDCCHFGVGNPKGYIDAIHTLGKRIKYIHFSDSDMRTSELHYPLGKGKLDIDGIVDAFVKTGYSGQISLDTWGYPLPEETSRIGIPVLKKTLRKLGLD